jgi:hypothetical protein
LPGSSQKALHVAERTAGRASSRCRITYNLLYREEEREMLPLCRAEGIGVIPYSPLAAGRLTRDWTADSSLRAQTDQIAVGKYDATAETDRQIVVRVADWRKARRGACADRAGLAAAKDAGDRAHHRRHEVLASGGSRWRAGRQADAGRGRLVWKRRMSRNHAGSDARSPRWAVCQLQPIRWATKRGK